MTQGRNPLTINYPIPERGKKQSPISTAADGSLLLAIFPVILSLIIALSIFILKDTLPPTLPLFYSLPWGEQQLARIHQLLIIPATFACITLINLIIYLQLNPEAIIFKRILSITSIVISLILIISFFQVVSIFL